MGIIKKTTQAPAVFEAEDNGEDGGAAVAEQAGEVVEGVGAVVEETPVVKTVTRGQVAKAPAEGSKEPTAKVEAKDAEVSAAGKAADKGAEVASTAKVDGKDAEVIDAADKPKQSLVLARTEGGAVKTFLNSGNGSISPLADLRDAFKKAGIEIDYSTFPRIRVEAGCICTPEGAEAGDHLEVQVVSFGPSWTITTGVDGEEGRKWVRFSDDGKKTNPAGDKDEFAGMDVEEYKAHLIAEGFENSSIKEYLIVYGLALEAQEVDFKHLNEMVAVSLAPQSKKKWESYLINRAIQAKMGRVKETSGNPVVKFSVERVKGKDKAYFNLVPSHGVTEPVDLTS